MSAILMGLVELESGYVTEKGNEVLAISEACAEEALQRLRFDNSFTGSSLSFDSGSCTISISTNGSERTIHVFGTIGEFHKQLEVVATVNGRNVSLDSWQEVE
ncbi:MAG: hypothetical protein ABII02_04280 [Candidatus Magasanikbacteria bacterium]